MGEPKKYKDSEIFLFPHCLFMLDYVLADKERYNTHRVFVGGRVPLIVGADYTGNDIVISFETCDLLYDVNPLVRCLKGLAGRSINCNVADGVIPSLIFSWSNIASLRFEILDGVTLEYR